MGKIDKSIVRQSIRFKTPIPERILNSPKLYLGLELYLEAFYELTDERQNGMELGFIPRRAITEYAEFHNFNDEQKFDLLYLIKALDHAYLKYVKKQG